MFAEFGEKSDAVLENNFQNSWTTGSSGAQATALSDAPAAQEADLLARSDGWDTRSGRSCVPRLNRRKLLASTLTNAGTCLVVPCMGLHVAVRNIDTLPAW